MNICFSGGAAGADAAWGILAQKAGHQVQHFSFNGARPAVTENLVILSQSELEQADSLLKTVSKSINRPFPCRKQKVSNLLRRNYFQVKDTERVYAITSVDFRSLSRTGVQGGTAWAIEMAIELNVPEIKIFDQPTEQWLEWDSGHWIACRRPQSPEGKWTGIGSRELSDRGLQEIIDIFSLDCVK